MTCCKTLKQVSSSCLTCPNYCPDKVIKWMGKHWGIPLHPDTGGGYLKIKYCPWCGHKLKRIKDEQKSKGLQKIAQAVQKSTS